MSFTSLERHNALAKYYTELVNTNDNGSQEIGKLYLRDLYVSNIREVCDKDQLVKKFYLDDQTWVCAFYLFAQFNADFKLFTEYLSYSPGILTSDNSTVLHALCASSEPGIERKIRHVIEQDRIDAKCRNRFDRTCVYYLRGHYLPALLSYVQGYDVYDIVSYAYGESRLVFYVPEFVNEIAKSAMCTRDSNVIYTLVLPFVEDKADVCLQMALKFDRSHDLNWLRQLQKYLCLEKIPIYDSLSYSPKFGFVREEDSVPYESPRHELNDWLDKYLVKTDSPHRHYFLLNNARDILVYFLSYVDMMLQNPECEYKTFPMFCSLVPRHVDKLELSMKERIAVSVMDVMDKNPANNGNFLKFLAHWLTFFYSQCDQEILDRAINKTKDDKKNTMLHVLVKMGTTKSCSFVRTCRAFYDADPEVENILGETPMSLAKTQPMRLALQLVQSGC